MDIEYRNGRVDDCARLAEFVCMASDGVVEFLFHEGGAYLMKCSIK